MNSDVVNRTIVGSAPPYRKGGRITRKGKKIIRVHAGEVILPKKEVKHLEKLIHNKRRKNK